MSGAQKCCGGPEVRCGECGHPLAPIPTGVSGRTTASVYLECFHCGLVDIADRLVLEQLGKEVDPRSTMYELITFMQRTDRG